MTFVPNVLTFDDQSAQNAITASGLTPGQAHPRTPGASNRQGHWNSTPPGRG
jgi:hypothetical protein